MLFFIISKSSPREAVHSARVRLSVICASVEDGIGEKARRGATRSCPLGLGSNSSVIREAAGEAEQAAETTPGQHQRQTGRGTKTVSHIKKTQLFAWF